MLPSPSPPPIALQASADSSARSGGERGLSPSILMITGIIAIVFILSVSIHLVLRSIARRRNRPLHSPLRRRSSSSVSSSTVSSSVSSFRANPSTLHDPHQNDLINSLPLFTLSSAAAALTTSSRDCAVCLSRFDPDDQLRLLPACRHAFHSPCIDTWLRSTMSCPLCRSAVVVHAPLSDPIPDSRSESFRIEIGSVSRRRDDSGVGAAVERRSFSLGSSFEYVVDEEIEAVVAAVASHVRRGSTEGKETTTGSGGGEAPPGEEVAAAVGGGGSGRGWLRDYVDRIASSASSSFSSMRLSGRWSRRSDVGGGGTWDLEGSVAAEDAAAYYSFYRWLVGA